MRSYIIFALVLIAVSVIESKHTFLGTNVLRQKIFHQNIKYSSQLFRKRVESFTYNMPPSVGYGRSIQGILAYDKTDSDASANVTAGGLGFNYLTLRMKSARGDKINFDVYIYA